jgi:hypothetical protein
MSMGGGGGYGQPQGGYGGGYGGMQGPRMRFGMPQQAPQPQFSAGGGDPRMGSKIGVMQPDGSVGGYPTQVQTGGGSPYEGGMSAGGDNLGNGVGTTFPPPSGTTVGQMNPAGDIMKQQMQNIGGFQMPGQMPTQAPQVQTGGGDPYQVQNQALGPNTGLTPNGGMMQMNRINASQAGPAYGGGGTNWQDRPIGAMRQGMGIPQGWTADPNASGNPYWQSILNSRGPWTYNRG